MKKRILSVALLALLLSVALTACGKKLADQLPGSWYREGRSKPLFTLYDDGSCEIDGEYGTGRWALVNDNQLKLTNFYGESVTMGEVKGVEDGCLTIYNDTLGKSTQLWNSPQK